MPYKANAARRHHIPRPKRRVTNWAAYDAALRQRGSLTVCVSEEAIAQWKAAPRTTPGGQPSYSDLAITTALMLRAVFRLALRQTEGLLASILQLLGVDLAVPDHSTIARRARTVTLLPAPRSSGGPLHLLVDSTGLKLCGSGEWLIEKHGTKRRRSWRALHLGLDAGSGRIVAATLTDRGVDDASQVAPLDGGLRVGPRAPSRRQGHSAAPPRCCAQRDGRHRAHRARPSHPDSRAERPDGMATGQ